jgi:hypothetical protein
LLMLVGILGNGAKGKSVLNKKSSIQEDFSNSKLLFLNQFGEVMYCPYQL